MEALRNFLHQKKAKKEKHPSWKKMCIAWLDTVTLIEYRDNSFNYKEWNPLKDLCKSWEDVLSAGERLPKSVRRNVDFFSQLYTIGKLTIDKLEEVKIDLQRKTDENVTLRNQNSILSQRCEELQYQLEVEKQRMPENYHLHKYNLEKEVNLRRTIEAQEAWLKLQVQQKERELHQIQAKNEVLEFELQQVHAKNEVLEFELQQVQAKNEVLEFELQQVQAKKKVLEFELHQIQAKSEVLEFELHQIQAKSEVLEFELQQVQAKNEELEDKLSSLESQDTLRDVVDRLGQVNGWNVFDWLCSCEQEYKAGNYNVKDFEKILLRCMDSSNFASLPTMVKKTHEMEWLGRCRFIAETFVPDPEYLLYRENMREDDTVLQYFHRMWMIYRVGEYPDNVSKEDFAYKQAICKGLLPHLYQVGEQLLNQHYEAIESGLCTEEYFCSEDEKKRLKERKAGAGCPPRIEIWKRLMRYPVDYEKINEAKYFVLLAELSRHEDVETGDKITRIQYETTKGPSPYLQM